MKHAIILVFILTLTFHTSFPQTWPKYYGKPNSYDYADDIAEHYDQGYVICGNILTTRNETTQYSWVIKTDINGDTLWEKIITNEQEFIRTLSIENTSDGGMLLCGLSYVSSTVSYPYVMKLNPCGEKNWCKLFSTTYPNSWAQDIKETPDGEIIVLVNQFGENPEETMHLFKLTPDGEVLWQKPYCSGHVHPEAAIPLGNKFVITSNNEYLISGTVYWENPWNPGGVKILRPLFVLVDSNGIENWVLPYGLSDTIYGTADNIIEINNEYFIGVGSYWTNQEYVEPLFMKFDKNGNEVSHQILYTSEITSELVGGSFEYSRFIDDTCYAGGCFNFPDNLGYPIMEAKLHYDTLNFILTPLLNKIYQENSYPYTLEKVSKDKLLSNSTYDQPYNWDISLSKLNLNLEYDTLDTGTYNYDSLCIPGPPQSGFISLDDCDIVVNIDEMPSPEQYYESIRWIPVKAFPNPVKEGKVTFALDNTGHHSNMELHIYNIFGSEVSRQGVYRSQQTTEMDITTWPAGIYLAVIFSNGGAVGREKFVVE